MTLKMGRPNAIKEENVEQLKDKEYYTIDELSEILKVSRRTIERQIKSGKIKAIKIGVQYRIKKTDFVI